MFRTLRTLCTLTFFAWLIWFSFNTKLGTKTFAEHIDTISKTPAARDLLQGTRSTINPMIYELKRRMVGEYIEAPASLPEESVVKTRKQATM